MKVAWEVSTVIESWLDIVVRIVNSCLLALFIVLYEGHLLRSAIVWLLKHEMTFQQRQSPPVQS